MAQILSIVFSFGLMVNCLGQTEATKSETKPVWTEADQKYLLENLTRSKKALIAETEDLSVAQWNFKADPDTWSISQIVEHLALYEVIFMNEIYVATQMRPRPNFKHYAPDSIFLDQDPLDQKRQKTTDFTKPFSHTVPLGNNKGEDNLTWLLRMHDEFIAFVDETDKNLRVHYINFGPNVHQKLAMVFTHVDRHVRQIGRTKAHPNFPN